jgi:hypothetical protein
MRPRRAGWVRPRKPPSDGAPIGWLLSFDWHFVRRLQPATRFPAPLCTTLIAQEALHSAPSQQPASPQGEARRECAAKHERSEVRGGRITRWGWVGWMGLNTGARKNTTRGFTGRAACRCGLVGLAASGRASRPRTARQSAGCCLSIGTSYAASSPRRVFPRPYARLSAQRGSVTALRGESLGMRGTAIGLEVGLVTP